MDSTRRNKLLVRWALVSAGLVALFWGSWYLTYGSVPMVSAIKLTPNWTLNLPFSISRWWDVLMAPVWSTILILIFTNHRDMKDKGLALGLTSGLVFMLASGPASGLVFGLAFGAFGLVLGLVLGLVFMLASRLALGLVTLISVLTSKATYLKMSNWLLAKD